MVLRGSLIPVLKVSSDTGQELLTFGELARLDLG
jgi:hypothetical protein